MNLLNTLKIFGIGLAVLMLSSGNGFSAQGRFRPPLIQKAEELAQKALEAAKAGDLTTSQQHLDQIETLTPHPRIKANIQNSPVVQGAKKAYADAKIAKAEEEKRAKDQVLTTRKTFEQERAQKQMAQQQEDAKKAALRAQRQPSSPIQPEPPPTPPSQAHQAGKGFTSSRVGDVVRAAQSTNLHSVLEFQTDAPPETFLKPENLGEAALAESKSNLVAQQVITSAQDRPTFKIDPQTDPLFVQAQEALQNPQATLQEDITEIFGPTESSEEIKTCEEGGDEYSQTCTKRLDIELKITPEHQTTVRYCPGHSRQEWQWHGFNSGYITKTDYCGGCTTRSVTTPKKVEIVREGWVDGCTILEDHVDQGFCRYVSTSQSPKNETRMIQGEALQRDHFEEHFQYACFQSSPNACAGLREQGCYQIKSVCREKRGDVCILWQQTLSCPSGKQSHKSYQNSNKANPFCLTGTCADTSYEANGDLLTVMSHLQTLRDAQQDLKKLGVIFKGNHRWCTRNCFDFRDCCGSDKGWGVEMGLTDCDGQEIELRTLRDQNLCIQIGTYCAEKNLGKCTRKKTTFCCYGTKLARLIQQNARAQLGLRLGSPESPDCNGLSAEHLSRLDFSQINFSEIFEEITRKMGAKDQTQSLAAISTQRLQENMAFLTKPPADPQSIQGKQTLKGKGL